MVECQLAVGVHLFGDKNLLVYDEINLQTEFNMEISQEVIFANFASLRVTPTDDDRSKPLFTTLDFTPEDYDDVWDFLEIKTHKWLSWLNTEVL